MSQVKCPACGKSVSADDRFCRHCATRMVPGSISAAIGRAIETRVNTTLDERLVKETNLVGSLADKVEKVFWKRLTMLGGLILVVLAIFAWLGFKSVNDLYGQFKPAIDKAKTVIATTQADLQAAQKDSISAQQIAQAAKKGARTAQDDINNALDQISKAESDVTVTRDQVHKELTQVQSEVDNLSEAVRQQAAQLARQTAAFTNQAQSNDIGTALPGIGQPRRILVGGREYPRGSSAANLVHIYIDPMLAPDLQTPRVKQLENDLSAAGFIPSLGIISQTPTYQARGFLIPSPPGAVVFYFRVGDKDMANAVYAAASKTFKFSKSAPELADLSNLPAQDVAAETIKQTSIVCEIVILSLLPR